MKNLVCTVAGIMMAIGGYAQVTEPTQQTDTRDGYGQSDTLTLSKSDKTDMKNKSYSKTDKDAYGTTDQKSDKKYADGVLMSDGKMWLIANGEKTALQQTMTMGNGTKVMSDGTYTTEAGEKMMLGANEHMDMQGKMTPKKKKD